MSEKVVHFIADTAKLDLLTREIPEGRFFPACGAEGVTTANPAEVTCDACRAVAPSVEDYERRRHELALLDVEAEFDAEDRPGLAVVKTALDSLRDEDD